MNAPVVEHETDELQRSHFVFAIAFTVALSSWALPLHPLCFGVAGFGRCQLDRTRVSRPSAGVACSENENVA